MQIQCFFYRKIDDDLKRCSVDYLNKILHMAKIDEIESNLSEIHCLSEPNNLFTLRNRFMHQCDMIEEIKKLVYPFSWDSDKAERFAPIDYLTGYWDVFQYNIHASGSGVISTLDKVAKKIDIALSKIFLVTGMAGQGKTNFICDLVENQFRFFDIPTLFIPARSLNDYFAPNRLLSYIKNNRFAPDVADLHEFFTLLNSVAEECQKPFIIAIDGINEVGDLDGFVAEIRVFLEALCQYDFVKIIITCRNKFFDHKFAKVFESELSEHLHRVQDLRNAMSENNKNRLLRSYVALLNK